jgi:hypothetical protein
VSPVKYELGFYIPEDAILHSRCRENLKSYRVKGIGELETALVVISSRNKLRSNMFLRNVGSYKSHTAF